ncbi:MAG: hypothetical protein ABSF93_10940 [Candidatus Sulfotelmatobacter sp.]|jgi:hypothetical protein
MTIALESMAVTMPEVEGHPNRAGFRGVLTVVDVPSQRAPAGSKGRRVLLTRGAAEAALPSLLGMALDYAPSFDRHDVRRKVGVITSADVVGRNLEVSGYLYAKDFPDIVEEVGKNRGRTSDPSTSSGQAARRRTPDTDRRSSGGRPAASGLGIAALGTEGTRLRASLAAAVEQIRSLTAAIRKGTSDADAPVLLAEAGAGELGMSFEVTDVLVTDTRERVWTLMKVTFTGAAILRKDKAAYRDTWIELSS